MRFEYRLIDRGVLAQHENFAELYRFHAGSHLYAGFELLWGLLLLSYLGTSRGDFWRTTWSIWLVVLAWLFAPFWFNPLAFDRAKLKADASQWLLWMERKDANMVASWEVCRRGHNPHAIPRLVRSRRKRCRVQ